jgi:hypothetical protein
MLGPLLAALAVIAIAVHGLSGAWLQGRLKRIAPHEWARLGAPGEDGYRTKFGLQAMEEQKKWQNLSSWALLSINPGKLNDQKLIQYGWIHRLSFILFFVFAYSAMYVFFSGK